MREICKQGQPTATSLERIAGVSSWSSQIRRAITEAAKHDLTVLITGPSGTGKQLIAESIHAQSRRSHNPFLTADCATIPGPLFASQMFGHRKGAFTGANSDTLGCFRAAEGGTVFLDELGELDLQDQAKLLRVLQQRTVVPCGSVNEVPIDVRVVAATNRDLFEEVDNRTFREDLFYRLNVVHLKTAPLHTRPEDIEPLSNAFLTRLAEREGLPHKQLSIPALRLLASYVWPGNVRELENTLARAAVASNDTTIQFETLSRLLGNDGEQRQLSDSIEVEATIDNRTIGCADGFPTRGKHAHNAWRTLAAVEKDHIERTLERTCFNQAAAARLLGITRKMLYDRLKRHGIDASPRRRRTWNPPR